MKEVLTDPYVIIVGIMSFFGLVFIVLFKLSMKKYM